MTPMQKVRVEQLRRDANYLAVTQHKNGEVKKFEVNELTCTVSVYIVIGAKGDEGTMAAIFCRDNCHLFIGKRGSVYFPVWDEKKKEQRYKKYTDLFLVSYDQEHNNVKGSYKR